MTYKGIVRIKCVDLANWAARENLFSDMTSEDPVRFSTEGMDTVIVYVQKTDTLDTLLTEMTEAMDISITKFGGMSDDLLQLMTGFKAVLALGSAGIKQSFKMQLSHPGVSPYMEVVIKAVE